MNYFSKRTITPLGNQWLTGNICMTNVIWYFFFYVKIIMKYATHFWSNKKNEKQNWIIHTWIWKQVFWHQRNTVIRRIIHSSDIHSRENTKMFYIKGHVIRKSTFENLWYPIAHSDLYVTCLSDGQPFNSEILYLYKYHFYSPDVEVVYLYWRW